MTQSGTWPKNDGDILYSSDINRIARPILLNYLGSDLNNSIGSPVTSWVGSYIFPFIPVGSIYGASYLRLNLSSHAQGYSPTATSATAVCFYTQHREISGTFANVEPGSIILLLNQEDGENTICGNYNIIHPLNAAEIASGVQIMGVTTLSTNTDGATNAVFTNKQFYIEAL